jgi:hypothetical protein
MEEIEYLHGSKQLRAVSMDGPGTSDGRKERKRLMRNGSRVIKNGKIKNAHTTNKKRPVRKGSHVHTNGSNVGC